MTRDSLECPNCQYSLRGQAGDIVRCPECGLKVDIVRLIQKQWTGPWYRAPMYTLLAVPVAVTLGTLLAVFFVFVTFEGAPSRVGWGIIVIAVMLGLLIQAWLMVCNANQFGAWFTVSNVILLHFVFALYSVSVIYLMGSGLSLLAAVFGSARPPGGLTWITSMTLLISIAGVMSAWYMERFIAGRCIRQHLRQTALNDAADQSSEQ